MADSPITILTRRIKKAEAEVAALKRHAVVAPFHALKAKQTTIVGAAIVATRPNIALLPGGGTEADLKFIGNFDDGKFVILAPSRLGDTITLKDQSGVTGGNIDLGGSDIDLAAQGDNLMLYYVAATSFWQIASSVTDGGGGGGATTLDDLVDVDAPSPSAGDGIFWDNGSSLWVAGPPDIRRKLGQLDDVDDAISVSEPDDLSLFMYDATAHLWSAFPNAIIPHVLDDLTDVILTIPPTDGQVLMWVDADSAWEAGTVSGAAPVDSVNSKTGVVVLDPDDLSDVVTIHKFVTTGMISDIASAVQPSDLAAVAFSGAYADLSGSPAIPATFDDLADGVTNKAYTATEKTKLAGIAAGAEVNVNADWTAVAGDAEILHKPATFAPSAHHTSHEHGGSDEVIVAYANLTGIPSTFAPAAHAASHQHGGADEVATATAAANAIPKANGAGKLALAWLLTGSGNGLDADKVDGQEGVYYLARGNHTGAQTASTISDFDTQVRTSRLDQMASPSADVSINSHKLTNVSDPASAQDAATKAYVDAFLFGYDFKASVRAATTANITLSGAQTIDGVSVIAGDRVLVKDQTTGANNGIYVAAAGAWSRSTDADASAEVTAGMFTFVSEGTVNGDNGFALTTNDPITLGTTALVFTQVSGAGQIVAGNALTKSGNTLDWVPDGVTLEVSSDQGRVKDAGITYAKIQNIATDSLVGRDTAGSGAPEQILLNATLVMDGSLNLGRAALTGDVTAALGSNATAIGASKVLTAMIADANITLAKLANIATDSLIGRDTAGSGVPENITLNATLEMDGSGHLQRAALTSDVTAAAGSNATTIAANAVTNAKAAQMAANTIKGNNTGSLANAADLTTAQVITLLGLAIGTNVQAFDASLTSIALLGTAADRMLYTTGVDTWAELTTTSFGRSVVNAANAAAGRTLWGLGTIAVEAEANYFLLAGRAGGQSSAGGNAANDDLTLQGTTHATRTSSYVLIQPNGGFTAFGHSVPVQLIDVRSSTADANARFQSTSNSNYAGLVFYDDASALQFSFQYGNSGASVLASEASFASRQAGTPLNMYQGGVAAANLRISMPAAGGVAINDSAAGAALDVNQATLGSPVLRLRSVATNDDPTWDFLEGRAATTNATIATIATVAIPTSNAVLIEVDLVGHRTGGAAGAADDVQVSHAKIIYKNSSGTVTGPAALDAGTSSGSAGITWGGLTMTISGTNVLIQVTGQASVNITWHAFYTVRKLNT